MDLIFWLIFAAVVALAVTIIVLLARNNSRKREEESMTDYSDSDDEPEPNRWSGRQVPGTYIPPRRRDYGTPGYTGYGTAYDNNDGVLLGMMAGEAMAEEHPHHHYDDGDFTGGVSGNFPVSDNHSGNDSTPSTDSGWSGGDSGNTGGGDTGGWSGGDSGSFGGGDSGGGFGGGDSGSF